MSTTRGQHLIGKMLGSCVLQALLGYGGSSAVFLAQQHTPERKVAVKVFLPRSNMDANLRKAFYQRFLHEAKAASELDHPNILPVYSYGEEDDLPYIIMPYMEGGTLYEYVGKHGPLSLEEARLYLEQIASALDHAHEHGCVHCDVKPANILLDSEGRARLSDFGIARVMQDGVAAQVREKDSDTLMGTPDYISPEQALGQHLDGRSDIYSLGVTLFFLLAGRPPFIADSTIAMALLHVHEPPPILTALCTGIPERVDRALHKALAKFPEERFRTAGQFAEAFSQAVSLASEAGENTLKRRRPAPMYPDRAARATPPSFSLHSTIRVRPAWLYSLNPPKVALISLFLLVVMVGASIATGVITLRLTQTGSTIQATALPIVDGGTLADRLLYGGNDWPRSSTFFFANGQYHIQNNSAQDVALALYANHRFSNFRLSLKMSEVRGTRDDADFYGVVFRADADQSHYYVFEMVSWGEGQYEFLRYDGHWKTLADGPAPSLLLGPGQFNTVTVVAQGNTFNFFVNNQRVGKPVTDASKSALSSGGIGLYVEEQGTEVAFSHLRINPLR